MEPSRERGRHDKMSLQGESTAKRSILEKTVRGEHKEDTWIRPKTMIDRKAMEIALERCFHFGTRDPGYFILSSEFSNGIALTCYTSSHTYPLPWKCRGELYHVSVLVMSSAAMLPAGQCGKASSRWSTALRNAIQLPSFNSIHASLNTSSFVSQLHEGNLAGK